jgi:hypothetical protein
MSNDLNNSKIRVSCICGKEFLVAMSSAGKSGNCPECGEIIAVPSPSSDIRCSEIGTGIGNAFLSVGTGIGTAFLLAFPLASVIALVYRFPIPLVGILSGPNAMVAAMYAVLFYGMIGGAVALGFVGLLAGIIGHCWHPFGNRWATIILLAAIGDTVLLLILASLDMIIGPW